MAVELIKPDPADEPDDTTAGAVAEVIELALVDDQVDEGAADTSRPRALLDLALREFRQALDERHDPPAREQSRAPRALAAPSVWSLRHYVFHLGGFRAVGVGSVIIWRKGQAVRGKAAKAKLPAAKPPTANGQAAAAPKGKGKGKAAKQAAPAKGKGKAAKKAAPAKGKGKAAKKAAPPAAPSRQGMTFQGAIAGVGAAGLVMTAVAKEIKIVSVVVIILVAIWIPVAWLVGGFALTAKPRQDGIDDVGEQDQGDVDDDAGEQDEDGEVADAADAPGETGDQAAVDGGEVVDEAAARDAARVRTYAWVRAQIAAGNGRAVHLRTLCWTAQKEAGGEGLSMADVRAGLEGHGVTIRPQVKALCPDDPKVPAGVEKNRPGVHRDDLPQGYTPAETAGSTLIRLLPDLQGSDLQ